MRAWAIFNANLVGYAEQIGSNMDAGTDT